VAALFASGRIIDLILLLMLVEIAVLALLRGRTRRGISTPALFINLAAGAALLLALRAALSDHRWPAVAFWLLVALIAHVVDLRLRWAAK
jgi:hypothetical protein